MTKFGDQPALRIARRGNRSIATVASAVDVSYHTLYGVLTGRLLLTDELRERLPKYLGLPLEDLFTTEFLSHKDQRGGDYRKWCGCICDVHGRKE